MTFKKSDEPDVLQPRGLRAARPHLLHRARATQQREGARRRRGAKPVQDCRGHPRSSAGSSLVWDEGSLLAGQPQPRPASKRWAAPSHKHRQRKSDVTTPNKFRLSGTLNRICNICFYTLEELGRGW